MYTRQCDSFLPPTRVFHIGHTGSQTCVLIVSRRRGSYSFVGRDCSGAFRRTTFCIHPIPPGLIVFRYSPPDYVALAVNRNRAKVYIVKVKGCIFYLLYIGEKVRTHCFLLLNFLEQAYLIGTILRIVSTMASHFNSSSIIPFWLDGKEVTGSSSFQVISPLNNQPLYRASSASEEEAQIAVSCAEKALKTWSSTKPSFRRDIFLKAAEGFRQRRDELRQYSYKETGQAPAFFGFEYSAAIDICLSLAGLIQIASESTSPIVDDGSALLLKEPWGVVLAIAPWNAPYVLGVRAVLTPLAM